MKERTDPQRNTTSEKGERHDPALHDSSAAQPGMNTISSSSSDQANEELTKTSSGNFGEDVGNEDADQEFDEGGGD